MTTVRAFGLAGLLLCVLAPGCDRGAGTGGVAGSGATDVFVFVDRSHFELEHDFVLASQGIFAQVSVFPGYGNRQFYFCREVSARVRNEAENWKQHAGEITPPFIPGGPWFSRTDVTSSSRQSATTVYFRNENADLRRWLSDLKGEIVRDENRVEKPPEWVSGDERIKERLGL